MRGAIIAVALVVAGPALPVEARAGGFEIPRSVFAGGAVRSIGATYGVSGTVGQSATGGMSNAEYAVKGGYVPALGNQQLVAVSPNTGTRIPTRLHQNQPNPFNPHTTIRFELSEAGPASLEVFDVSGRLVATLASGEMPAGSHTAVLDGNALASGVYFCRLRTGNTATTRKLTLLR